MTQNKPKSRDGFTLVELSIVLVIIGLLAGGILVGRDLITAAEINSQISQIEKINTAYYTFRTKHNCMPGDCGRATEQGLGDNGDGNEILEILPSGLVEHQNFWIHLGNGNLIEGKYATGTIPGIYSPALKLPSLSGLNGSPGGLWVVTRNMLFIPTFNFANSWILTTTSQNVMANGGTYNGYYLFRLDSKIDDGLPTNGTFQAAGNLGVGDSGYCVGAVCMGRYTSGQSTSNYPEACVDYSANPDVYNITEETSQNALCSAIIKAPF